MFGLIGKGVKKTGRMMGRWADVPMLKKTSSFIHQLAVKILKQDKAPEETFEQALKRLKLTPKDIEERKNMFKLQILIYGISALAVGAYTVYLIMGAHWISVTVSLCITVFLAAHAFKSHFWLFQIKQRKLGCTLQEYLDASIKESK